MARPDPRKQGHLKGSRNPKIIQYKAPETPRGQEGKERKEFTLAEHANVFDHNGEKRYGGETIMLSEAEANHFASLGYLAMDLQFTDERDDEITKLRAQLAELKRATTLTEASTGSEDSSVDDQQASNGASADASGGESGDGDVQRPNPPKKRASGGRRRGL